jgi:hypothetical protein
MSNRFEEQSGTNKYQSTETLTKINNAHERSLKQEEHKHQQDIIDKDLGWIGKFFGRAENASKNITATLCILLLVGVTIVSAIVYYNERNISNIKGLWDGILPIITLSLGYLFGKK